jgi:hypothetical protein
MRFILPVHLGDPFHRRYRVMLNIGYGSYCTLRLAVDCAVSELSLFLILPDLVSMLTCELLVHSENILR